MTTRDDSIKRIAAAASPAVGIGIIELIPVIDAALKLLAVCGNNAETPEQFIAAHTNSDGSPSHMALVRLSSQIIKAARRQDKRIGRQEAVIIARRMFDEGQRHGERVGAVMRGESA